MTLDTHNHLAIKQTHYLEKFRWKFLQILLLEIESTRLFSGFNVILQTSLFVTHFVCRTLTTTNTIFGVDGLI